MENQEISERLIVVIGSTSQSDPGDLFLHNGADPKKTPLKSDVLYLNFMSACPQVIFQPSQSSHYYRLINKSYRRKTIPDYKIFTSNEYYDLLDFDTYGDQGHPSVIEMKKHLRKTVAFLNKGHRSSINFHQKKDVNLLLEKDLALYTRSSLHIIKAFRKSFRYKNISFISHGRGCHLMTAMLDTYKKCSSTKITVDKIIYLDPVLIDSHKQPMVRKLRKTDKATIKKTISLFERPPKESQILCILKTHTMPYNHYCYLEDVFKKLQTHQKPLSKNIHLLCTDSDHEGMLNQRLIENCGHVIAQGIRYLNQTRGENKNPVPTMTARREFEESLKHFLYDDPAVNHHTLQKFDKYMLSYYQRCLNKFDIYYQRLAILGLYLDVKNIRSRPKGDDTLWPSSLRRFHAWLSPSF